MTDLLAIVPKLIAWADQNPTAAGLLGALLFYVAWNVSKRPPPKHPVLFAVWRGCELLAVLPWDRFFGRWTPPFKVDPPIGDDEVPTPKPRGLSLVSVLCALSLVSLGACSWLRSHKEAIHVIAEDVCHAVMLTLPEIGPVCVSIANAERIWSILAAAKRDGVEARLRFERDGRNLDVNIPADTVAAMMDHVGARMPAPAKDGGQ